MITITSTTEYTRKGFVLIAVLWLAVLFVAIVTISAKTAKLDTTLSVGAGQRICGKWAARAAIEKVIYLLNKDSNGSDSMNDSWAFDDSDDDSQEIEINGFDIQISVIDQASKININKINKKELLLLPNMTDEIAMAIIDWRDKDNNQQPSGAEESYYDSLIPSYHTANEPFKTVRELLAVKGITEKLLIGAGKNDTASEKISNGSDDSEAGGWGQYLCCNSSTDNKDSLGNDRININKADESKLVSGLGVSKEHAKWIVQKRNKGFKSITDLIDGNSPKKKDLSKKENLPEKSNVKKDKSKKGKGKDSKKKKEIEGVPLDLETFCSIADKMTISDEKKLYGQVNINTAPQTVIEVLLDDNEQLAKSIVEFRDNSSTGIETIADLLEVKGVDIKTFKNIAGKFCTRSNIFAVRCTATSIINQMRFAVETIIDRSSDPAEIIYWYQEQ